MPVTDCNAPRTASAGHEHCRTCLLYRCEMCAATEHSWWTDGDIPVGWLVKRHAGVLLAWCPKHRERDT